ncbi:VirK/YbjX family protein [Massilia oculi]|uniref:VirK/YbjX family protein n=1 Tax=Massilia hydrophila TaxID=3044279 RepID=A0ABS7Y5W7_9BURK|nr:DUF535 family protein [Massilia oculi]MCA1855085.1 VirK/YbjX family protein [Massilia oculi]
MILAHLSSSWRARRRQHSPAAWVLGVVRSLRVLRYWREHQALCRLDLVRRHVAGAPGADLFRHLSQRSYLARGLSVRERVQCVLSHYRFEDASFGGAYHQAVHGGSGLTLWQHEAALDDGQHVFSLRLQAARRALAEGEGGLAISLLADGRPLHRLCYSWVDGALAGAALPTVPFITRNEGRWHDAGAAFAAFEQAFPNNSPSFFCFAAMQGLAQALGIDQVAAIKCAERVSGDARAPQQADNAYDGFWRILGGIEQPGRAYLVHLPFYLKPLADMPSKHRKRAAQRRECWRAIGDAARGTLLRHLAPATRPRTEAQAAPATAQA